MAYGIQFYCIAKTELNQDALLLIARKDTAEASPTIPFECEDDIELQDDSDEGTIISRTLTFTMRAEDWIPEMEWDTFLSDNYDEWWCILYVDEHAVFEGFIVPEEGNRPLLDKPYPISITATNGLKLLKDAPLTNQAGARYKGKFSLIEYISSCLSKTLLNNISDEDGIPLRIYANIYEGAMVNRAADITKDFYQQTYLDHRSLLADATVPMNCYDVLATLLGRHSRLFYWNARWVIEYIGEHQYAPNGRYYTEYTNMGVVIGGALDEESYAQVGKAQLIYPINENPFQSSSFAIKSAKTRFEYNVFPELPLNNKFERGTLINTGAMADIYDEDGDNNITEIIGTFKRQTIDDWTYGPVTNAASIALLPAMASTTSVPSRRSVYNQYGIELYREIILPRPTGGGTNTEYWLQSSGIPVNAFSKIKITFNVRIDTPLSPGSPSLSVLRMYIITPSGTKYWLNYADSSIQTTVTARWITTTAGTVFTVYSTAPEAQKYRNITLETALIPVDGMLYVAMVNDRFNAGGGVTQYYSAFDFEYIPYVAGGYVPVKGDYWLHGQNKNIIDVDDENIGISDCNIQVVKGVLEHADGTPTRPTWYREGLMETRHFKELVNIARYNLRYRRFWSVEGEFNSVEYEPVNDPLNKQPLSYHKNYYFPDFPAPREFVMIAPLKQNITRGTMNAIFEEVTNPSSSYEVSEANIELIKDKIIGAINSTPIATWQSNGLAPAVGTAGFPPSASRSVFGTTNLFLFVPTGTAVILSASANGAGNTPTLTQVSSSEGTLKLITFAVGPSIAVGNTYTITIFGVAITIEVENVQRLNDGTQTGDFQEFNFIF